MGFIVRPEVMKSLSRLEFFYVAGSAVLGSGAFGQVLKGTYQGSQVAVKMLKNSANSNADYLRSMLGELKVMSYLGSHPSLVGLIGAITANIKGGEIYIIFECCSKGNAHKFVRGHRDTFVNMLNGKVPSNPRGPQRTHGFAIYLSPFLQLERQFSIQGVQIHLCHPD